MSMGIINNFRFNFYKAIKGSKIISNKNESGWAKLSFQSPAKSKPILSLKSSYPNPPILTYAQSGPYPAH